MKHLAFILLLFISFSMPVFGQSDSDSLAATDNVIMVTIPANLKIKDKIFLVNKSPYLILQAMIALPKSKGDFEFLGNANYLASSERATIASYENNELKNLRGKTIAIKVKGAKVFTGENRTGVATPMGDVGVAHTEIASELVNNLDPKDITYSFEAKLHEEDHDLYIEVYYKGDGKKILDF